MRTFLLGLVAWTAWAGEAASQTTGEAAPPSEATGQPATKEPARPAAQEPQPAAEAPAKPAPPAPAGAGDSEQAVPITRAENAKPDPAANPLPPEGKQTVRRRARLERNAATGWCMLRFENVPDRETLPPGWVLPCRLLEKMEDILAKDPKTVFEVSCDNTIYDERCFVMLRGVRVAPPPAEAPAEASTPPGAAGQDTPPPATSRPGTPAESRPAEAATGGPASRPTGRRVEGPSAQDVMQLLMKEKAGAPVMADDRRATAGERPKVAGATREQPTEGLLEHTRKLIINRRALLVAAGSGAWKEVRFYDDNNLQVPPLRVLPSALLKRAESFDSDIAVTGEITVYRGRQYIYLHSAEPVLPLGRF